MVSAERPGAALGSSGVGRHRWRAGLLVAVVTSVGAALLASGPKGVHPSYDLGLALVSGATVGLVFVVVESLLASAADARAARSSLLLQLALTEALEGIDLTAADLRDQYLPNKRLIAARFVDADLRGASLLFADLRSAQMARMKAAEADLGGSNFEGADLREADLQGAVLLDCGFSNANLTGAVLRGADLRYSTMRGSLLGGADLPGANLDQTDLRGADLRSATLDQDGARLAVMDEATLLPAGVERSEVTEAEHAWTPGIDLAGWLVRRSQLTVDRERGEDER